MRMNKAIFTAGLLAGCAVPALIGMAAANAQTSTAIDRAQAERIALGQVQGAVSESSLESEAGRAVWEVELDTASGEAELYIDAESGEVLAVELEDRGGDNDDDDRGGGRNAGADGFDHDDEDHDDDHDDDDDDDHDDDDDE